MHRWKSSRLTVMGSKKSSFLGTRQGRDIVSWGNKEALPYIIEGSSSSLTAAFYFLVQTVISLHAPFFVATAAALLVGRRVRREGFFSDNSPVVKRICHGRGSQTVCAQRGRHRSSRMRLEEHRSRLCCVRMCVYAAVSKGHLSRMIGSDRPVGCCDSLTGGGTAGACLNRGCAKMLRCWTPGTHHKIKRMCLSCRCGCSLKCVRTDNILTFALGVSCDIYQGRSATLLFQESRCHEKPIFARWDLRCCRLPLKVSLIYCVSGSVPVVDMRPHM